MFAKKIPIIYLSKTKLKVALIKLGKNPKIIKTDETGWNKDSLGESFKQAKKQLKSKSIRILLGDDLSYVLSLNIPFDTKSSDERELIKDKIKPEIPEILEHDDWDFKETGRKTQKDKQVIAFAPVKSVFSLISQSLADANLKLQAIEPEIVSKIRNENPLIGIALKKDLKGKDEKVLNLIPKKLKTLQSKVEKSSVTLLAKADPDAISASLKPKKVKTSEKTPPPPSTNPQTLKINKTIIIIFVITLALGSLVTGGILVQRNALESRPNSTPAPLIIPSPEPSPTPSPSPSPEPEIVLSDYKIQALNGTGGKGVAGAVKDLLEENGFKDVAADNANKLNHQQTTVQLKENTPEKVWQTIEQTLNSAYEVTRSAELLADDSKYNVIITVGEKVEEN